jgi:hypothetical protein
MSSRQNYITEAHLLHTSYAMITLTSTFILFRIFTTQFVRPSRWLPRDAIIYFAYAMYLVMTILYIIVTPILYRLTAVAAKTLAPYPTLKDEHRFMVKVFFCNTLLFWCILWSVKLGFLMLYKRLMEGLHNVYVKLWWAVLTFWFLVRISGGRRLQTTDCLLCIVACRIRHVAHDFVLEYEGVVHAGRVPNTARCPVADCESVLYLRRGRLE